MYKIGILFQDREFEHDIYELIRAFYPGSEICSFYEEEEAGCDLYFRIEKQGDSCVIRYEDHENKGVTSAEFIEGQSSDALISCVDADDSEAKERAHAIRKERKDIVKIALYKLLVKLTGKTLPWGNLTGIRPAKLAMGLIESGMKNTEAAQEMRERYMVSPQKTALAITIANREREILKDIDYENGYSLYVGIPFCPSICLYCSFSSYPLKQWKNRVNQYLEALCKEIKEVAAIMKAKGRKLDTVYIGGGTPTTLEPEQLKVLLDALMENFCCENLAEFTIEAGRPDSITREKLMMIRNYPITRISVNPQTMNQETLDIIGRRHTVEETKQAFMLARECGFDNINMDLIVGLPGEDKIMVENTLNEVKALAPDSMTPPKENAAHPYFYKTQLEKTKAVRDFLAEHISENFTQEELSARFDFALTPMKTCFKAAYGTSIGAWLTDYRMNYAAEILLREKRRNIAEIAAQVGYDSASKFAAAFKRVKHMTPAEYRSALR